MKNYGVAIICALMLSTSLQGCGAGGGITSTEPYFRAKNEPWRRASEMACLQNGTLARASFIREDKSARARQGLGAPRICGAVRPLEVMATAGGAIALEPRAVLRCPMVPALDNWARNVVQPAAFRIFGEPIVSFKVISSYSCRPRNNKRGAKLSEHGFANAIDIASFRLASGRQVSVKDGWRSGGQDQDFLRRIHKRACDSFTTVLGPNADKHHHDHFHLDLARHGKGGSSHYCR